VYRKRREESKPKLRTSRRREDVAARERKLEERQAREGKAKG